MTDQFQNIPKLRNGLFAYKAHINRKIKQFEFLKSVNKLKSYEILNTYGVSDGIFPPIYRYMLR